MKSVCREAGFEDYCMGDYTFWEEYNQLRDLRTRELLANYQKQEFQLESRILEEMAATVDRKLEKLQSDRDQFRRDQREFEKGCESIRQLQRKLQTGRNSLQQREGEEPLPPALISASTSRLSLGRTKKGEIVFGGVDEGVRFIAEYRSRCRRARPLAMVKSFTGSIWQI
jgi:hypothetical protein